MIVRSLLAASLSLAFATAFAQDPMPATPAAPATPATAPADAAPMAPADAAPMASDKMSGSAMHKGHMHHHAHHRMHHGSDMDHGMRIDHSADHMVVTPTESKMPVPAGGN